MQNAQLSYNQLSNYHDDNAFDCMIFYLASRIHQYPILYNILCQASVWKIPLYHFSFLQIFLYLIYNIQKMELRGISPCKRRNQSYNHREESFDCSMYTTAYSW